MTSTIYNLEILAATWNRLDVQLLEPRISEKFSYESQFVFKQIKTKAEFISHLEAKFIAIRFLQDEGFMSVFAQIGYLPSINMRPCIILTQIVPKHIEKVLLLIDEVDDLISSINVCYIPDPDKAIISSIQPN